MQSVQFGHDNKVKRGIQSDVLGSVHFSTNNWAFVRVWLSLFQFKTPMMNLNLMVTYLYTYENEGSGLQGFGEACLVPPLRILVCLLSSGFQLLFQPFLRFTCSGFPFHRPNPLKNKPLN